MRIDADYWRDVAPLSYYFFYRCCLEGRATGALATEAETTPAQVACRVYRVKQKLISSAT